MRIGAADTAERVLVVAEIGNNHEGDVGAAEALVDAAAEAGADAVKLQALAPERYVSRADTARFAMLSRFQLTPDAYAALCDRARGHGLLAGITPFDPRTAEALRDAVDFWKVASGDNDFVALIRLLAGHGHPLLISTGASTLAGVHRAVALARAAGGDDLPLAVMHCVSSYPTPPGAANLRAIPLLASELACEVGYSDHTEGAGAAPLAVALGARIIEKHFTLDRHASDFRDHQLSADPDGMRELVARVREAEAMLGTGRKEVHAVEDAAASAIRRSVVAARALPRGHVVAAEDVSWVRPGGGLPPGGEDLLIGRALRRDVADGERLTEDDVT